MITKMNNPWNEINLATYEKHTSLGIVLQLQALNRVMKEQFYSYPAQSIMILGVAGGNGLEETALLDVQSWCIYDFAI